MRLHRSRKLLLPVAAACLALLASACGSSSSAASSSGGGGLLAALRQGGTITIGTSSSPPLSSVDASGKWTGALPDMFNAFLARENLAGKVTVKGVAMPFDSLIPALRAGQINMVGDAMYATAQRKKIVGFTNVTFYNPEGLVVKKGNPENLHQLSELCGHSVGSYIGTTYVDLITQQSAKCGAKKITLRTYPNIDNVLNDIANGRLDAGVVDASLTGYALKKNSGLGVELASGYQPIAKASTGCAFAVTKSNQAFLKAWNKTYAEMKADGTVARIFRKWGLTPTSVFLTL